MKKQIISLAFVLTASACTNTTQKQQTYPKSTPLVVANVIDYSLSCSPISYFDSSNARELIYALAPHGGKVIPIAVLNNSTAQSIRTLSVPNVDTENTTGITNAYRLTKIQATNKKKLAVFQQQIQEVINAYTSQTIKLNEEKQTDLQNSLHLAEMALSEPVYKDYKKIVLICSDMLHDVANKKKLRPVRLPNTTILLVRPALSQDSLQALFPESQIYLFANTSDAIQMIK